ncbi:hypothetical protein Aca07nite_65970 [Actinoplanes capillaceus]|uniref:Uncharacterized protein n=1 Tax=Actinoplanes campanulatus TaxID=113559 RepID=A0ABQ3WSY0_9ACTN|nr:hypothetical protein [Actinoplanes capillaceus]GID49322.1 hypothetical protein Aca07nite_65970 [Actinoplanes capillaceus]
MRRIVTVAGVAVITTLLPPPIARSGDPVPDPAPDADAFVLRILDAQGNPVRPVPTVTQAPPPASSPSPTVTPSSAPTASPTPTVTPSPVPATSPTLTVAQPLPVTSSPAPAVTRPAVADPGPARPMAVVTPSPSVIVVKPGPAAPKPHRPATTPPVIIVKPTLNRPVPAVAEPVRSRPAAKPAVKPTAASPHRQRPRPHRDHRDRPLIVGGPDGPGIHYDGLGLNVRDLLPDFCHRSLSCPISPAQWPGLPPTVPMGGWGFGF